MKSKDVTCMVCARLNSERVHQKMIRPFADSSLLEIALNKLQSCDFLDKEKIYLSAIEPEIKPVGEKLGIKIYNRKVFIK
jgi:CMP-N-acetylneuraminic acid synthetase